MTNVTCRLTAQRPRWTLTLNLTYKYGTLQLPTAQCQLASCLIYARPLRPDRWLVGARFIDSWRPFLVLVWVHSFIELDFLKTMYHSTIYHSNLSDQSALEIGLGLGLDSELHYFSIFSRKIRKMSNFSSANITDSNLVLKERTHRIKN